MAQKKAKKPVKKAKSAGSSSSAKKASPAKTAKAAAKPGKSAAPKVEAAVKVAPKAVEKIATKTAKVKPVEVAPAAEKPKQTKKQALLESKPEVTSPEEDKNVKKAKKALGRAKQSLAKARAKDFGSKLGKNLISQGVDELTKKWESLYRKAEGIESKPYRMKDSFEERTAIEHKILGWGFVLSNQNDRLEVLFRDGIRYLISNYKT